MEECDLNADSSFAGDGQAPPSFGMSSGLNPTDKITAGVRERTLEDQRFGVYIGRFSPVHLGHQNMIETMINRFTKHKQYLVLIGSCTEAPTLHNPFDYPQRVGFLKTLYPNLNVVGLPDVKGNDMLWRGILTDLILYASGADIMLPAEGWADKKVQTVEPLPSQKTVIPVFYGGCTEDLKHFISWGFETCIINRYETNEKMSSSEVKDCLVHARSLENKVDSRIALDMQANFANNWQKILKGDHNA